MMVIIYSRVTHNTRTSSRNPSLYIIISASQKIEIPAPHTSAPHLPHTTALVAAAAYIYNTQTWLFRNGHYTCRRLVILTRKSTPLGVSFFFSLIRPLFYVYNIYIHSVAESRPDAASAAYSTLCGMKKKKREERNYKRS